MIWDTWSSAGVQYDVIQLHAKVRQLKLLNVNKLMPKQESTRQYLFKLDCQPLPKPSNQATEVRRLGCMCLTLARNVKVNKIHFTRPTCITLFSNKSKINLIRSCSPEAWVKFSVWTSTWSRATMRWRHHGTRNFLFLSSTLVILLIS